MSEHLQRISAGIHGVGEIGRDTALLSVQRPDLGVEIAHLNYHHNPAEAVARHLRRAPLYARPDHVEVDGDGRIVVDGHKMRFTAVPDPARVPWETTPVDIVIDSARTDDTASAVKHLRPDGPFAVVVSSPIKKSSDGTPFKTVIVGVNDNTVGVGTKIYSAASCSAQALYLPTARLQIN